MRRTRLTKYPERPPVGVRRVSAARRRSCPRRWIFVTLLGLFAFALIGILAAWWFQPSPLVQPTPPLATVLPTQSQVTASTPTLAPVTTSLPLAAPLTKATTPSPPVDAIPLLPPTWQIQPPPTAAELQAVLDRMSVADKAAQLLIAGFNGDSLANASDLRTLVGQYHVGGLVLLEANARDPQQVSQLVRDAQQLARSSGAGVPLFISSNHEGGPVVRIGGGVTGFPGNMAVAATGRLEYAYIASALAARELRAMGINMNLAPVLDVNDNPLNPVIGVRSFGDQPALVAEYGRMSIRGLQDNGIIAVAKHFPGHGSVAIDSHGDLPVIAEPLDQLLPHALLPFTAAISENVPAIMSAHIALPAIDATGLPATLSSPVLTSLLRDRLKFDGLIVTDSLGMGAITNGRGQPEAAVEAILAGADIVLTTGPLEAQLGIIEALQTAVHNGRLSMERLDQSVRRVLLAKYAYGLFEQTTTDLSIVGSPEHQQAAYEIALRAVTVLHYVEGAVPLGPAPQRVLIISPDTLPSASDGQRSLFAELLQQRGYNVTELTYDLDSAASRSLSWTTAMSQVGAYDVVVFGEWELIKRYINNNDLWQEQLIATLAQSGVPTVVVAWHNPAALMRCPVTVGFLTAYGNTRAQVQAVAEVLSGKAVASGRLPMTLTLNPN